MNAESLADRISGLVPIPLPKSPPIHLANHYGLMLIPLRPNSKLPFQNNFPEKATRDGAKLQKLLSSGSSLNFGISLARDGQGRALIVADVDRKNGKDGFEVIRDLEEQGKEFPPTYTQRTPSGGLHLVYFSEKPINSSFKWTSKGLEILAGRRQIVAAGSKIDGKAYEIIDDRAPVQAPDWLVELCGTESAEKTEAGRFAPKEINGDSARARATDWLVHSAPVAIENQGGDRITFSVAAKVKDFGCDEAACLELLFERWNSRCEPPWSHEELRQKVQNAYAYGSNPIGADAPEMDFSPIPDEPLPKWLLEDNKEFAVVNENGSMLVYRFRHDYELSHEVIEKRSFEDHKKWGRNKRAGEKKNRGEAWLDHPKHREYDSVAFVPGGSVPAGVLNLWRGFNTEPKRGNWTRLRRHIKDVLANGDPTSDAYLMGWLARMVQRPGEQGEVAIILRGGRGTGKGVFAGFLKTIFGRHAIHLTNAKHLVGNFNSHLRDKVFAFMDEAFFAGDVGHESILKGLITEPTFIAEAKYRDAATVRNYTHILAASNEGWVVPAGQDERRFCVLDCSSRHQQDSKYFAALISEAENGGIAAMLHDLLSYDLSTFDVRQVPQTAALAEQKIRTLRGPAAWLHECLQSEAVGLYEWREGKCSISKQRAHDHFREFCQARRWHRIEDVSVWARQIKAILGPCVSESRKTLDDESGRARVWEFREIGECRQAFSDHYKIKTDHWENDEPADEIFN